MTESGELLVVATPIGNLGDLTPRAADALRESDVWIVEDKRVSGKLGSYLGVSKPMWVANDHTSDEKLRQYVEKIEGQRVALLTDAGTPGLSDPGARLVDLCREENIPVIGLPGPSAVTCALMLSGFYAQRFAFLGFLPRTPSDMRQVLEPFVDSTLTLVLFESPFRLDKTLEIVAQTLGSRRYALCRELTKLHEQVWRGETPEIPNECEVPRRGEFTIVVEGTRRSRSKVTSRKNSSKLAEE